jgi:hypothetical protein
MRVYLEIAVLMSVMVCLLGGTSVQAQTVISNETLVTTTFVVSDTPTTTKCNSIGCYKREPMLTSIPVTCPAAIGQTCTFHIALDAEVETTFRCRALCDGPGPHTSYQFLVDGAVPTPGPVGANGENLVVKGVWTASEEWRKNFGDRLFVRQSYPTSVIAKVTNSSSGNHIIDVDLICFDEDKDGGCLATAHRSAMRVDVFEP